MSRTTATTLGAFAGAIFAPLVDWVFCGLTLPWLAFAIGVVVGGLIGHTVGTRSFGPHTARVLVGVKYGSFVGLFVGFAGGLALGNAMYHPSNAPELFGGLGTCFGPFVGAGIGAVIAYYSEDRGA